MLLEHGPSQPFSQVKQNREDIHLRGDFSTESKTVQGSITGTRGMFEVLGLECDPI